MSWIKRMDPKSEKNFPSRSELLEEAKRIIIKIGSSTVSSRETGLDHSRIEHLASQISNIKKKGKEIILVSSGAIASGMKILGKKESLKSIPLKQAAAAAGQSRLIWSYEKSFSFFGERVAQILLTQEDLSNRRRFLNSRNTLTVLLEHGIIPIINENDTVAIDEIRFGDNDALAGLVTHLVDAHLLLILSDVDGLFTSDPGTHPSATLIPVVTEMTPQIDRLASGRTSKEGTGGMQSKLQTAKKVSGFGVATLIINGKSENILERVFQGEEVGTLILPKGGRRPSRKNWIAHTLRVKGKLLVDEGATHALLKGGKSLLSSGILRVNGKFGVGDPVCCIDPDGLEFAKGLVNYSSEDIDKIKGCKSTDIENILGYKDFDEVIHRDNLALLNP